MINWYRVLRISAVFLVVQLSMTVKAYCPVLKEPIYCQIMKNKPNINWVKAHKLAGAIERSSLKHGVRADILTAIIMRESSYRMGIRAGNDYGLTQINIRTVKAFGFDIGKLMTDLEYSVEAGAIVLADFKKRYYKREPNNYWSRYNHSRAKYRRKYEKGVKQWLKKVNFKQ